LNRPSKSVETLPTVTINPVDGTNVINAAEAANGVALSGNVSGLAANSTFLVTVTDNGVTKSYTATVTAAGTNEADRSFLANCLQNANWLTKSLEQRARTILKVASEIVRQQDAFLAHGVRHLRPLNLRTIADSIAMHESTVSRVTSNKYIATPRGVFELKYFFTAAIQSVAGTESHSAEAVRDRIRELIDKEDCDEILSDDRIVAMLTEHGVNIARRTVAKYREAMRIPSSVERRRLKQMELTAAS